MIISAKPFPCFSNFLRKIHSVKPKMGGFYFFPLGRDALLSGLIALELKKGDSILIPAYMCDSTIQPLRDYGFKFIFLDVDKKLNLPTAQVQEAIDKSNVTALLVVHYFGFIKNFDKIIDICHTLGVKVIEDCSHSFLSQLSRDEASIKSDMEIFSMRKSLPVQDGGALRINSASYKSVELGHTKCFSFVSTGKYLLMRLVEKVIISLEVNIYGLFVTQLKNNFRNADVGSKCSINTNTCQPSWQLSQYLNNHQYLEKVRLCVDANFTQLSAKISQLGFKLLVDSVLAGVTPQALIIYDEKGGLVDYLRDNGIGAWRWPAEEMPLEISNNPENYPNTIRFDKSLVLLPIHQSVSNKQCDYMVKILTKWAL